MPPDPRKVWRLEKARVLLKLPVGSDVQAALKSLSAERLEHLRGVVDWIEDYERKEKEMGI